MVPKKNLIRLNGQSQKGIKSRRLIILRKFKSSVTKKSAVFFAFVVVVRAATKIGNIKRVREHSVFLLVLFVTKTIEQSRE